MKLLSLFVTYRTPNDEPKLLRYKFDPKSFYLIKGRNLKQKMISNAKLLTEKSKHSSYIKIGDVYAHVNCNRDDMLRGIAFTNDDYDLKKIQILLANILHEFSKCVHLGEWDSIKEKY